MRTRLAMGGLIVVAVLAPTERAPAVQDLCVAGAKLESQGRFAQAEAHYLKAMGSEVASQRACGAEKLEALTGGSGVCAYAESLESTSPDKAKTAYPPATPTSRSSGRGQTQRERQDATTPP